MERRRLLACAVGFVLAFAGVEAVTTSRPQADAFVKKIALINQHAESSAAVARRTTVTENELNSWFVYRAQPLIPTGVAAPRVTIVGTGKRLGQVTVDLEAIGKSRSSGSTLDLWSYLGGKVPLSITGVLQTKDGKGRFELQAADISGVPVPKLLVQELLSHYTRNAERPQGVRLDDPFALPANIKQIEVGQGQAVVVQ